MTPVANLPRGLEGVVGVQRLISDAVELQEYAIDGKCPKVVVRPKDAKEVSEVVRFAANGNLGVVVSGSRSKLEIGMPPTRYDIALGMQGMAEIAHYDPGDMTLSVDAGTRLRELAAVLAEKGQFLPLAVPCYDSSTVGGAVASGIESVLRAQYGAPRDFVIGAEFVDGKGLLCKSGGRVVKNVTGYDLHKLLAGSLGTLGVITRVNFRTFPMPKERGGCAVTFGELEGACSFRKRLERSGLPFANMELCNAEFVRAVAGENQDARSELHDLTAEPWTVWCACEGHEAVVRRVLADVETLSRDAGARRFAAVDQEGTLAIQLAFREAFARLRGAAKNVVLFRMVALGMTAEMIGELEALAPGPTFTGAFSLRAAGIAYWAVASRPQGTEDSRKLVEIARRAFEIAEKHGGAATLLHAPTALKEQLSVWGSKRADLAMMQRVKQAFDPQSVLAPGRFVGGL